MSGAATAPPAARRGRQAAAHTALLAGAVGIGLAPLFVRWIHEHHALGPTAIAFWRLFLALPVFGVLLWWWTRRGSGDGATPAEAAPPRPRAWWLAVAGVLFAADLSLWHWSLLRSSVANATLLGNLAPVFVAIAAAMFLGQKPSRGFVVALALTISGGACLVWSSLRVSPAHLVGDALATGSAVFYAAYLMAVARLRTGWGALAVMTIGGAVACAAFLLIGLVAGERFIPAAASGWWMLAAFALVSQLLGQGLLASSLDAVKPAFASVTLLIQPVLATALAWPLFGERFGPLQAVGGVVVLVGIVLARRHA